MSLKFDPWYDFRNPPQWHQPPADLYAETLDQISWADDLGFSCAWVSEHHFTEEGYLPAVFSALAAMAMRTKNMDLGTSVLLAPLHHPLRLAEEAAVVDAISGGRLQLGLAPGYRVAEFEAMGIPKSQRGKRTDEIIELLIKAWTHDRVNHDGRHYQFSDVAVGPKPTQDPYPSLWIGGSSVIAAKRAARFGCNFMPDSGAAPEVFHAYTEGLAESGKPAGELATNMVVYVTEDPEKGWDEVKEHYFYVYQCYQRWFAEAGDLLQVNDSITSPDDLPRSTHIVGTPEMVIKSIEEQRERRPFDRLIFWARPPGLDIEKSSRSLELMATKVIPHFA